MNYYKLFSDMRTLGRWFLGEIDFDREGEFWKYCKSGLVEFPEKRLSINVREGGTPIDFNFADFDILILNKKSIELIDESEVQRVAVDIKTKRKLDTHYLMTIVNEIECVDEQRSCFDKWEPGNIIRPDKAGHYKTFYKLFVRPDKCVGHHIFRLKDYHSIIIVSEYLKQRLESNGITGVDFENVT